jgi:hypothetical protein
VIDDLSRTLQNLLTQPGLPPELSLCDISFESPAPPFNPAQDTVNIFLYDIQENLTLRSNEPIFTRQGNQAIRTLPPLRAECSYLITAWSPSGVAARLKEQLLLTQVISTLGKFPIIPDAFLAGALAGTQDPLPPMTIARGDELRHNAEFWTALGGKLRSSLRVSATISIPVFDPRTAFLVTTRSTSYDPSLVPTGSADRLIEIGGRVLSNIGAGLPGAVVDILDAGLRARTDDEGRYFFSLVPQGSHTFRAIATGFQPSVQARTVPGSPTDYEFHLNP